MDGIGVSIFLCGMWSSYQVGREALGGSVSIAFHHRNDIPFWERTVVSMEEFHFSCNNLDYAHVAHGSLDGNLPTSAGDGYIGYN